MLYCKYLTSCVRRTHTAIGKCFGTQKFLRSLKIVSSLPRTYHVYMYCYTLYIRTVPGEDEIIGRRIRYNRNVCALRHDSAWRYNNMIYFVYYFPYDPGTPLLYYFLLSISFIYLLLYTQAFNAHNLLRIRSYTRLCTNFYWVTVFLTPTRAVRTHNNVKVPTLY